MLPAEFQSGVVVENSTYKPPAIVLLKILTDVYRPRIVVAGIE